MGFLSVREHTYRDTDLEFLGQVGRLVAVAVENALAFQEIAQLREKLAQENLYLEEELRRAEGFEEIIGDSAALKQVLKHVEVVAPAESTVLILGETGTGKELIARHSPAQRPKPAALREAELRRHPDRPAGKRVVRA